MTLIRTRQHLALTLLLALAGCGGSSDGNDGGNCANNPAGCICITDANCGAPNPVCNNSNGQCVKCLPQNDVCPQGQHCILESGSYACVETSKCVSAADCPKKKVGAVPACCAGTCVDDVSGDKDNCGGCNVKCGPYANAAAACLGGACLIGTCEAGFANCDGSDKNGCESNLQTDTKHCGSCPVSCNAGGNATATCAAGKCGVTCVQGYSDCNGRTEDGCETATNVDPKNCGSCGKACGPLNNAASVVCINGSCTAGACAGWFGDCNGKTDDGCESDTQADPANCGGCGKACAAVANGKAGCGNGTCTVGSCSAGFGDCDGDIKNGCESRTSSDAKNCGACGIVCAGPNGQQSCSGGACVVSACNQGFADCDMKAANGCEINILSDINHCNGCGMACPAAPNTLPSCRLGVCSPGPCVPGFADCNKDPSDGCEVDITTTSNCGSCGVVCAVPGNATAACRNGQCQIGACNQGFADCDLQLGNGCERNLNTDNANCGICGLVCVPPMGGNIGNQCTQGKCVVGGCLQGFADCNKNINDGCEVNTTSDANNCGACGVVCPMNTPYCVNSVCGNSTHNIKVFNFDFSGGSGGCGDFSIWYTFNFGIMDYAACETLANNYGAQFMGQGPGGQIYNYNAPYVGNNRWVGEATELNAFIGTASWNVVTSTPKNGANIYCVLGYANASKPGLGTFNNTTAGLNGKTYKYSDYGVISEKTCYTNALAAGARPLNPWMMTLANPGSTTHMSENHSCHGSTQYCCGKGSYTSDGGSNHNYRCLVGYND